MQELAVQVADNRRLADPPLMRLESEGGHAYLSMLLQLSASQTQVEQQAEVEARLVSLGLATLQRFQVRCKCSRARSAFYQSCDVSCWAERLSCFASWLCCICSSDSLQ